MLKHRGAALACSSTFDGSLPDRPLELSFASLSFSSALFLYSTLFSLSFFFFFNYVASRSELSSLHSRISLLLRFPPSASSLLFSSLRFSSPLSSLQISASVVLFLSLLFFTRHTRETGTTSSYYTTANFASSWIIYNWNEESFTARTTVTISNNFNRY